MTVKEATARAYNFFVVAVVAIVVALACWKAAPLWGWLTGREWCCWLAFSTLWWLCLDLNWVGPVVLVWATFRALRERKRPPEPSTISSGPIPQGAL